MTIFDEYGAPQFGVQDCKIATWNDSDDYEDEVDVPSVQMVGHTLQFTSAQLEGDDRITATASIAIGGQITFRFGSLNIDALEVMLGQSPVSSDSAPNRVKQIKIAGGNNMPYFGLCAQAVAAEGDGDTHIFIPKCKITDDFQIAQAEYGAFIIPEVTLQCVDDSTYGVAIILEHEAEESVAIPPTKVQ